MANEVYRDLRTIREGDKHQVDVVSLLRLSEAETPNIEARGYRREQSSNQTTIGTKVVLNTQEEPLYRKAIHIEMGASGEATIVFDYKQTNFKAISNAFMNMLNRQGYSKKMVAERMGMTWGTVDRRMKLSPNEDYSYNIIGSEQLPKNNSEVERIPLGNGIEMVCASESSKEVVEKVKDYAEGGGTVLIQGESGTGKDLVARLLHIFSERRNKPYIKFNSAQIPPEMAESILFGHEKGAFTSAFRSSRGLFRQVDGGTIFLDEVSHLPPPVRAKLLTFFDTGEIISVGSQNLKKPDFFNGRVVTATNKRLDDLELDEDLVERLTTGFIELDPLRERPEDIRELGKYFLEKMSTDGKQYALGLDANRVLLEYDWPRNARELKNVLYRASVRTRRLRNGDGNAQIIITGEQIKRNIIIFEQKHG